MSDWVVRMPWTGGQQAGPEPLVTREWLVTNGLGGYASGTVAGLSSRRYHGLLIAALPAPLGRQVMLNHLSELLRLPDGNSVQFGGEELATGQLELHGIGHLKEFALDARLPVWRFEVEGFVLNRLQGAVLREAYCLVRDGIADVDDIDRVVRDGFGRRYAVIGPFETVRVLLVLSKVQGFNVNTSFTCGPVPGASVLVPTVKIHEPKRLLPEAFPPAEESVKAMALSVNSRVVAPVRAG